MAERRPPVAVLAALPAGALMDRIAIGLSGVCAIHCLIAPLMLVALPVAAGTWLGGESFHLWLLALILPLSTAALTLGCRRHKDRAVMLLGAAGMALLVLAVFLQAEWLGENGERILTLAGSATLIAGHVRNFRMCRVSACSHDPASHDPNSEA